MRSANDIGHPVGGVGPSLASQGFVEGAGTLGIVPLAPQIEGIENVSFNDFTFGVDITGLKQANNTAQWADNYSRIIGRHTLKIGGEFHTDQVNINPNAIFNGSSTFRARRPGWTSPTSFSASASNYAQGDSRHFYLRNHYIGAYAQDAWQLRRDLTLNYGLRWDVLPPWSEKYNQLQTLVLGEQSVFTPERRQDSSSPEIRASQTRWLLQSTLTSPPGWAPTMRRPSRRIRHWASCLARPARRAFVPRVDCSPLPSKAFRLGL